MTDASTDKPLGDLEVSYFEHLFQIIASIDAVNEEIDKFSENLHNNSGALFQLVSNPIES